jgi:mRNA-capping enzyme
MLKPHLKLVEPQKKAELETVVKKYMYNSIFDEFLGTIPTVLTREKLELLKKHKYCVSWKADGIRYLMYVVRKNEIYLIDRNNDYFKLVTKYFIPKNNFPDLHLENTLLDGEMVLDIKDKKLEMRYLVFDVIVFGSQFVREDKFLTSGSNKEKNRYYCVRTAISKTYNDQTLDRDQPFYIYHKSFYYTTDLQKILNVTKELPHSHDGLIFLKESEVNPYSIT